MAVMKLTCLLKFVVTVAWDALFLHGNEVSSVNSWIISATYIHAYKASSTYSLKLLVQLFLRLQKPK